MNDAISLPELVEKARIANSRSDAGSLEMFAPPQAHVLVTRAIGHMTVSMAEAWVARAEHLFALQPRPLAVFNEWSAMTSYDSEVRRLLTSWVLDHRKQIEGAWFLTGSRMVAMGVAVANVATAMVGVTMHASLSRETWEGTLQARLSRSR